MFTFFATSLYGQLLWLGNLPRTLVQMLTSLERIFDVLEENEELPQSARPVKQKNRGAVVFEMWALATKAMSRCWRISPLRLKGGNDRPCRSIGRGEEHSY